MTFYYMSTDKVDIEFNFEDVVVLETIKDLVTESLHVAVNEENDARVIKHAKTRQEIDKAIKFLTDSNKERKLEEIKEITNA